MLADNYQLCLNRFKKLKERLRKTPQLLHEYNKVFDEIFELRNYRKVKNEANRGEVVYLPTRKL